VSNANWDESDIKASIAALSFILTNSAKFNVESDTLANELQQLGLPKGAPLRTYRARLSPGAHRAPCPVALARLPRRCGSTEHSVSLCKSYKSKVAKVQERLREESLRGTRGRGATRGGRGGRYAKPAPQSARPRFRWQGHNSPSWTGGWTTW